MKRAPTAKLLGARAAGRLLGVCARTLRRYVARRWLPAVRIGERFGYAPADVALLRKWGPPLMPAARAARALDVHPNTVRRWFHKGRMPFVLVKGGRRCVARPDLVAFAHARKGSPARLEETDKTRGRPGVDPVPTRTQSAPSRGVP